MATLRWVKQGDEQTGPFSEAELRRMAADGRLRPDALLSTDREEWVRAIRFAGLFPPSRLRDTPPPLPSPTGAARTSNGKPASAANGTSGAAPAAGPAASSAAAADRTSAAPANESTVVSAELLPVEAPPVPDAPLDVAPPPQPGARVAPEAPDAEADALEICLPELPPLEPRLAADPGLSPRTRAMLAAAIGGVAIGFLGTGLAWRLGLGAASRKPDTLRASSSTPASEHSKKLGSPATLAAAHGVSPLAGQPVIGQAAASGSAPQQVASLAPQPLTTDRLQAAASPAAGATAPRAPVAVQPIAGPVMAAPQAVAGNVPAGNKNLNAAAAGAKPPQGPPVANGPGARRLLVLGNGGTPESEAAVEAALFWLATHQLPDGGWSYDHSQGSCSGRCANPGTLTEARNAATAMALLPFLAAGYSHEEGPYQANVWAGLNYLVEHMAADGSFWEPGGSMYSQGLATTALCEAYNLCADRPPAEPEAAAGKRDPKAEKAARAEAARLAKVQRATLAKASAKAAGGNAAAPAEQPAAGNAEQTAAQLRKTRMVLLGATAQQALAFIVSAQHPKTGGWRYMVGDEGDTSVVGWQLMALRAGLLGGLRVPKQTLAGASQFLDAVQIDDGAEYGYQTPMSESVATSAIGLLARQVLGWNATQPAMLRGAQLLASHGVSEDDMYFNFYADQVLHNLGGPLWEQWNPLMREFLVHHQVKTGHAVGSWMFMGVDAHAEEATHVGGRLYNTAMATLVLQVYYRHAPIYSRSTSGPQVAVVARKPALPEAAAPAGAMTVQPAGAVAPPAAIAGAPAGAMPAPNGPQAGAAAPPPAAAAPAAAQAPPAQPVAPNMADAAKPAAPPAPDAGALAMAQPAGILPKMPAAANMNPVNKNMNGGAAPAMPQGPPPAANDRGRRRMLVLGNGGTPESEAAVEMSLTWLAAHQMTDGGWSFDHRAVCGDQCPTPGSLSDARNAATGMALLPFLAAGYSHEEGPYRMNIWAGLNYLISHMGEEGSLWEPGGTMYSQGIATTALCEAYNLCADRPTSLNQPGAPAAAAGKRDPKAERAARLEAAKLAKAQRATLIKKAEGKLPGPNAPGANGNFTSAAADPAVGDAQLRKLRTLQLGIAAQKALDFIVAAQNPRTGGWRYLVGAEGDTSVVGWQLMALKAGHLADLRVPPATLAGASMFLDSVQLDYGAEYGYTSPTHGTPATTAIGLLARENLGWDASNQALQRGALILATHGPSMDDMYFNFYADQVLRNIGGQVWQQWNPVMRDYLVKNQVRLGHATGSWTFIGLDRHAQQGTQMGGRLYNTVLCTLILQVYYRHDPVYSRPTTAAPRSAGTPAPQNQPSIGKPNPAALPAAAEGQGAAMAPAGGAAGAPPLLNAPTGAGAPAVPSPAAGAQ